MRERLCDVFTQKPTNKTTAEDTKMAHILSIPLIHVDMGLGLAQLLPTLLNLDTS